LREHGVEVIVDLPGVGANYQGHFEVTVREFDRLLRRGRLYRAV